MTHLLVLLSIHRYSKHNSGAIGFANDVACSVPIPPAKLPRKSAFPITDVIDAPRTFRKLPAANVPEPYVVCRRSRGEFKNDRCGKATCKALAMPPMVTGGPAARDAAAAVPDAFVDIGWPLRLKFLAVYGLCVRLKLAPGFDENVLCCVLLCLVLLPSKFSSEAFGTDVLWPMSV